MCIRDSPQGSVLGPFLFSIYVDDVPRQPGVQMALFADEMAVFTADRHVERVSYDCSASSTRSWTCLLYTSPGLQGGTPAEAKAAGAPPEAKAASFAAPTTDVYKRQTIRRSGTPSYRYNVTWDIVNCIKSNVLFKRNLLYLNVAIHNFEVLSVISWLESTISRDLQFITLLTNTFPTKPKCQFYLRSCVSLLTVHQINITNIVT